MTLKIFNGLEPRTDLHLVVNGELLDGKPDAAVRDNHGNPLIHLDDLLRLVGNLDQIRDTLKSAVTYLDNQGKAESLVEDMLSLHAELCQAIDIIGWESEGEDTFIPDHALAPKPVSAKEIANDLRYDYIFRSSSFGALGHNAAVVAETIAALIAKWARHPSLPHNRTTDANDVVRMLKLFSDNKELTMHPEPPESLPKLDGIAGAVRAIKQANPYCYVVVTGFKRIEVYPSPAKIAQDCIAVLPSGREIVETLRAYALVNEG